MGRDKRSQLNDDAIFPIKCKNCGDHHNMRIGDMELKIYENERSMGFEVEHHVLLGYNCDHCKRFIFINLFITTYPSNILNHVELQGSGYFKSMLDLYFKNNGEEIIKKY